MYGTAGLQYIETFEEWLLTLEANSSEDTVKAGMVPSTTMLVYDDERLIGMIDMRHRLNDYLFNFGGHIGYSVRKSERKKGYASEMLKLALIEYKKHNVHKCLITCNENNIASAKTIIKNGGILENQIVDNDNTIINRYWINI